ncbi:MAG: hypothetical protein CMF60_04655 [Magnetococcales bacterium]|nr:hypothetical protein [Magnetococcales bacterium]|tara:strand:+ start:20905 stop:21285 length:381 start_codon:yes stop_codon:yes gene_type:complete
MKKNIVNKHVLALEKSLLTDKVRTSKALLNELLHDNFNEISQSGTVYGKSEFLENLPTKSSSSNYEAYDFTVQHLSDDLVQVRFETLSNRAIDGVRCKSLRSSLWKLHDSKWQMIFHQGTVKSEEL